MLGKTKRLAKFSFTWPFPLWVIRGYATVSLGGQTLKLKDKSYGLARRIFEKRWEPGVAEFLRDTLNQGDIFIDIGAHVGAYTLLASKLVGSRGQVYAFEPDPVARRFLYKNIGINRAINVTILPLAVSDVEKTVTLAAPKAFGGAVSSIGAARTRFGSGESLQVRTITLDGFCSEHAIQPDLVKVDVEGAESAVIAGGGSRSGPLTGYFTRIPPYKTP